MKTRATPNPYLLNKICLNQEGNIVIGKKHTIFKFWNNIAHFQRLQHIILLISFACKLCRKGGECCIP